LSETGFPPKKDLSSASTWSPPPPQEKKGEGTIDTSSSPIE